MNSTAQFLIGLNGLNREIFQILRPGKWDNEKNIKINNGVAELTLRQNSNNNSDDGTYFKSWILKSYKTFTHGYFEDKIKGADLGEGVCPAIWLFSNFDYSAGEGQPRYCEIDIVELQQFDWYKVIKKKIKTWI